MHMQHISDVCVNVTVIELESCLWEGEGGNKTEEK